MDANKPAHRIERSLPFVLFLALTSLAATGCRVTANFHTVEKGKLYRSAQLTEPELQTAIDKAGIKTIINLRGKSQEGWYKTEKTVADENGVLLIDIPMSAERIPHRQDLIKLMDAFRDSPRPILIHCAAGADRTGEAAAIYQMEYMDKTREQALEMLTPKYFHFTELKPSKRYFIRQYQGAEWVYEGYDPCVTKYKYYDQEKFCTGGEPPAEPEAPEFNG